MSDLGTFAAWFNAAAQYGPFSFYHSVTWCDYPPLNIYIFWTFGSLAKGLSLYGTPAINFILKLPSTLFDTATAGLIFLFLRKRVSFNSSLIAMSLYAFNPATIFNGSVWGQFDAIYTFFLILSIILIFQSRFTPAVMAFTAAVLTKPQSIALAPLIVFLILKKRSWKAVAWSVLASVGLILVVTLPLSPTNLLDFLTYIYLKGYRGYPYTSLNAFNLWAFGGFWKSDAQTFLYLDFFKIGWLLFGGLSVFSLYYLYRTSKDAGKTGRNFEIPVLFTAFVLLFGFFVLPTRIHERYLFPVFSILAMMLPFLRETRVLYGILTFVHLVNLAYVLPFLNAGAYISDGDPLVYTMSAVTLATFAYTLLLMVMKLKKRTSPLQTSAENSQQTRAGAV
jgi:Gpi18-like mannosyltransferase